MTQPSPIEHSAQLQLWLLHWTAVVPPPQLEPLMPDHLRYMVELEERGVLFASGPVAAADGTRAGAGLTALRAADEAHARALADDEPFAKQGLRSYTLQRWTVIEGNLALTVRLSDSSVDFAAASTAP